MKNFKACLWVFLLLIAPTVLSSSAFAQYTYGNFTYDLNADDTVNITGYTCPKETSVVIIPAMIRGMPVVNIARETFVSCKFLTSVTIPNSVKYIGYNAFGGCSSLTSLVIPDNVTSIGDFAFSGCRSLTSLVIPDSVTSIGDFAFSGCTNLKSVSISSSVKTLSVSIFSHSGLTIITIPSNVTSIKQSAFWGCSSLTTAYFLGDAPSMGEYVFNDCASSFSICYPAGAARFTTPTWQGYPAKVCAVLPSSTTSVSATITTTTQLETSSTTFPSTITTTVPSIVCAAEALYGRDSEETELLREYRDKVLSKSETGRQLIKTYYELSPAFVEVLQKNDAARACARRVLDSLMPVIREKVNQ